MDSELTESSSAIRRIVSAINSAVPIWRIFLHAAAFALSGMVSVTTSSSITEFSMRSIAGPDNTGCVQYATSLAAPCSFNAFAASDNGCPPTRNRDRSLLCGLEPGNTLGPTVRRPDVDAVEGDSVRETTTAGADREGASADTGAIAGS